MNFDQLPTKAPNTPVLDRVDVAPEAISDLSGEELVQLANELREFLLYSVCLLYTSPSPRDLSTSRMPSSA